jgi:hypothetical protein
MEIQIAILTKTPHVTNRDFFQKNKNDDFISDLHLSFEVSKVSRFIGINVLRFLGKVLRFLGFKESSF